jgi:hypothetical protein
MRAWLWQYKFLISWLSHAAMLSLTPRDLTFDQWNIHHATSDLGYNGLWRMDNIVTYF